MFALSLYIILQIQYIRLRPNTYPPSSHLHLSTNVFFHLQHTPISA